MGIGQTSENGGTLAAPLFCGISQKKPGDVVGDSEDHASREYDPSGSNVSCSPPDGEFSLQ